MVPKEFLDDIGKAMNSIFIMAVVGALSVIGLVGWAVFKVASIAYHHFVG